MDQMMPGSLTDGCAPRVVQSFIIGCLQRITALRLAGFSLTMTVEPNTGIDAVKQLEAKMRIVVLLYSWIRRRGCTFPNYMQIALRTKYLRHVQPHLKQYSAQNPACWH